MRALVTGAARCQGRSMALHLAQRGYDVAVHSAATDEADAAETVALIEALGRRAVALEADLSEEGQMQGLVPRAIQALGGPLTVLVNSAFVCVYDTIPTATRASWDRHFESNLRAPFVLTQAFERQVPPPVRDEVGDPVAQGLVVNMLDQSARNLTPEFSSYSLAKMGLWALTQAAALGLAPRVRVNAIDPGSVLQSLSHSTDNVTKDGRTAILPRVSNPSDISAALGYFLDAPAVTGQLICTDGERASA